MALGGVQYRHSRMSKPSRSDAIGILNWQADP